MKSVVFKHIGDIEPVSTSHGVGDKRVIATQAEVGKPEERGGRVPVSRIKGVSNNQY